MNKELLAAVNGYKLVKEGNSFYQVEDQTGETMVNTSGTREEVKAELERWRSEVDYNNPFMLEIENTFINVLSE